MLRQTLRLVFALAVFVSGVTASLVATQIDATYPAGTTYAFGLDFRQSPTPKADILAGLEHFADSTDATLLRVYSTWENGAAKTYLISFGASEDEINLGEDTEVRPSSTVSNEDLSGDWALTDCPTCTAKLSDTVASLGGSFTWFETKSVPALIRELGESSTGFALVSVAVLLFSLALLLNASASRSRKIRAVNGSSKTEILTEDALDTLKILVPAIAIAGLIGIGYGLLPRTPTWTHTYFEVFLPFLALLFVGFIIINALIGALVFSTDGMADRRNPRERNITILAVSARIIALILVAGAIPQTLSAFTSARTATVEANRWAVAEDALTLKNSVLVLDDNKQYIERFTPFIAEVGSRGAAALAVTIDELVEMRPEALGGFDHVVMVDQTYLDLMKVPAEDLREVHSSALAPDLQETLEELLDFWSVSGHLDYSLYTWENRAPFPTIGKVSSEGSGAVANSPLIVVVHFPYTQLGASGFLEAFVSNGQLVFTDAQVLTELIAEYELGPYISSVDLLADQLSATASTFKLQSQLALIAASMAVASFLVIIVESAHTWASHHRRLIFAQITAGQSSFKVMRRPLAAELLTLVVAIVLTFALSGLALHIQTPVLITSVLGLASVFIIGALLAYRSAITSSFSRSIQRKN